MTKQTDALERLNANLEAIEIAQVKVPSVPVKEYIQAVQNVWYAAKIHKSKLVAVGLNWSEMELIDDKIDILRLVQGKWSDAYNDQSEAEKLWKEKSPEAYALRDELMATYKYAFSGQSDLITKLQAIEADATNADLVQDLTDLAIIGRQNSHLLQAINFDINRFDQIQDYSSELSQIIAAANGERKNVSEQKLMRDKAYTYLKQTVDRLIECGKFVFRKDDSELKKFSLN